MILRGNSELLEKGSFVLQHQPLATKEGFRNVAKKWYDKTISFPQAMEKLEQDRSHTTDLNATLDEMVPAVNEAGRFVFRYQDGREFQPTRFALTQLAGWASTSRWVLESLSSPQLDRRGRKQYDRDRQDAETLLTIVQNGLRRTKPGKLFLWRIRDDNTLRAILSDRYAVVDNRWLLESMEQLIPGGRVSHWRGNSDSLYTNILIPDSIRAESDSDYGGMFFVGNSEIGESRLSVYPSLFRAICWNGCIWGQKKGEALTRIHRGRVDLNALQVAIRENLNSQIPLLNNGINSLLQTRMLRWENSSATPLLAQVAMDARMSRKQVKEFLGAYDTEAVTTPEYRNTLFGIINAITRAGQNLEDSDWVRFDELGGRILAEGEIGWERTIKRAMSLRTSEIESVLGMAG